MTPSMNMNMNGLGVLALCVVASAWEIPPPRLTQRSVPFAGGKDGYRGFRMPTVAGGSDGSIVVAAEGRTPSFRTVVGNASICYGELATTLDTQCYMRDIVTRRSTDGGLSFSDLKLLAMSNETFLYSNPLLLFDIQSAIMFLAYVRCPIPAGAPTGRNVFVDCVQIIRSSADNGVDWSAESEVVASFPMKNGGVGAGMVDQSRLLFPRNGLGMVMSDDQGKTWRVGANPPVSGDSQPVQLANDNSLVLQMTYVNGDGDLAYALCRSHDHGNTFDDPCGKIDSPILRGTPPSIVRLGTFKFMAHLVSDDSGNGNMYLATSEDGGSAWEDSLEVYAGPAGYNSLAIVLRPFPTMTLLYEKSDTLEGWGSREIELAIIHLPGLP